MRSELLNNIKGVSVEPNPVAAHGCRIRSNPVPVKQASIPQLSRKQIYATQQNRQKIRRIFWSCKGIGTERQPWRGPGGHICPFGSTIYLERTHPGFLNCNSIQCTATPVQGVAQLSGAVKLGSEHLQRIIFVRISSKIARTVSWKIAYVVET